MASFFSQRRQSQHFLKEREKSVLSDLRRIYEDLKTNKSRLREDHIRKIYNDLRSIARIRYDHSKKYYRGPDATHKKRIRALEFAAEEIKEAFNRRRSRPVFKYTNILLRQRVNTNRLHKL